MAPLSNEELIEHSRGCLAPRREIAEAYLFGSVARGTARRHSDVDVAVYLDPENPPQSGYGYDAELATELMSALETNRVDVVLLNRAGPLLYHRVLRDGVRVVSRDLRATTSREGYALSRYFDWLPQQRKLDAAISARAARGEIGR